MNHAKRLDLRGADQREAVARVLLRLAGVEHLMRDGEVMARPLIRMAYKSVPRKAGMYLRGWWAMVEFARVVQTGKSDAWMQQIGILPADMLEAVGDLLVAVSGSHEDVDDWLAHYNNLSRRKVA